ncbi:MAG: DUF3858 domain-containing protein [Chitinophagales bacterium]
MRITFILLITTLFLFEEASSQDKLSITWGKLSAEDFNPPNSSSMDTNTGALIMADIGNSTYVGNKRGWFSPIFKRKTRIKILDKKGLDAATINIFLYVGADDYEKVSDLVGSTFNLENGTIQETKLDKKDIFNERLDKQINVTKFTMPAAKAGSIFEYSYTITSPFDYRLRPWQFQNFRYPTLWSEYEVDIPNNLIFAIHRQGTDNFFIQKSTVGHKIYHITEEESTTAMSPTNQDMSVSSNTNNVRWVMKNVPALDPYGVEKYITTEDNYVDQIEFQLAQIGNGETVRDFHNSWAQATEDLLHADYFGVPIRAENDWLDPELKKICGNETDQLQAAKKIYYFMSQNYTCTNHYSRSFTVSISDALKKRAGSVGDINLTLIALLRQKGIKADPVLLSTREYGKNLPNYPLMDRLNYVICLAYIGANRYYLDACDPFLGFGYLPAKCYNGHARIISEKDSGSVYFNPESLHEQKTTSVIIINDEKGFPSGGFQSTPGYYESHDIRNKIRKSGEKEFFKEIQSSLGAGFSISNIAIDSLSYLELPVNVHYDFDFTTWKNEDIIYFEPMLNQRIKENPFNSVQRKFLVEMPFTPDEIYTLSLEVPKGYTVDEIPKSAKVTLNGTDGSFEYTIQATETDVQLRTKIKLNKATFTPDEYGTLRDFFAFVVKKESEQIVFKKKKS